jgi:hypothetical protein
VKVNDENRGGVTIRLTPLLSIDGRVASADGAPVPQAVVTARPADGGKSPFAFGALFQGEAVTDEQGLFTIADLAAGTFHLEVRAAFGATHDLEQASAVTALAGATGVEVVVRRIERRLAGPYSGLSVSELGRRARAAVVAKRDDALAVALWEELLRRKLGPAERSEALLEMATSLGRLSRTDDHRRALRDAVSAALPGSPAWTRATVALADSLASDPEHAAEALDLVRSVADGARARLVQVVALESLGRKEEALAMGEKLAADIGSAPESASIRARLVPILVRLRR